MLLARLRASFVAPFGCRQLAQPTAHKRCPQRRWTATATATRHKRLGAGARARARARAYSATSAGGDGECVELCSQLEAGEALTITQGRLHGLSTILLHEFSDARPLATAMVHRSLMNACEPHKVFVEVRPGVVMRLTEDNERLELLGDRVLGLLTAGDLYERGLSEGAITQELSWRVSRASNTNYANTLGLSPYLCVAYNVRLLRTSAQPGNFLEALLGALYLDGGLPAAKRFFEQRLLPLMDSPVVPAHEAKNRLQERLVAAGLPGEDVNRALKYVTVDQQQSDGKQSTTRAIHLYRRRLAVATAPSRAAADQAAASSLLERLRDIHRTSCVLIRLARDANDAVVVKLAQRARRRRMAEASCSSEP